MWISFSCRCPAFGRLSKLFQFCSGVAVYLYCHHQKTYPVAIRSVSHFACWKIRKSSMIVPRKNLHGEARGLLFRDVDTVVGHTPWILPWIWMQIPQMELLFHGRRLTTGGLQGASWKSTAMLRGSYGEWWTRGFLPDLGNAAFRMILHVFGVGNEPIVFGWLFHGCFTFYRGVHSRQPFLVFHHPSWARGPHVRGFLGACPGQLVQLFQRRTIGLPL